MSVSEEGISQSHHKDEGIYKHDATTTIQYFTVGYEDDEQYLGF